MPKQSALPATAPAHDNECFTAMNVEGNIVDDCAISELADKIGHFDYWGVNHG